jgi:hypothetical protein
MLESPFYRDEGDKQQEEQMMSHQLEKQSGGG